MKTGEELHKIIDQNKQKLLGSNIIEKFNGALPFLPKVGNTEESNLRGPKLITPQILSIAKALPLQIHPNKDLSAKLHAQEPEKFTDANHKPEIAIALGEFEVFAGWKPNEDIQALFDELEPLRRFLPKGDSKINNESIRTICENIFKATDEVIKETQQSLQKIPKEKYGEQAYILEVLPRLQEQYSVEDPGNLVALLYVVQFFLPWE